MRFTDYTYSLRKNKVMDYHLIFIFNATEVWICFFLIITFNFSKDYWKVLLNALEKNNVMLLQTQM